MYLTDKEKGMLDGRQGEITRKCMEFLVAYGEAAGAERLLDIDGTVDLHRGTFWVSDYIITREEIEELADKGERFKVPTFANKATAPGFIFDGWENCGTMPNSDPDFHKKCMEPFKSWIRMGLFPVKQLPKGVPSIEKRPKRCVSGSPSQYARSNCAMLSIDTNTIPTQSKGTSFGIVSAVKRKVSSRSLPSCNRVSICINASNRAAS